MRRTALGLTIALGVLAGGTAWTQSPSDAAGAKATTRTNPRWARKPEGSALAAYLPERAQREGVSGRAVIECTVTPQGKLTGCTVVSEMPTGMGFGDAALRMSSKFQIEPARENGVAVEAAVLFPINMLTGRDGGWATGLHWAAAPTSDQYRTAKERLNGATGEAQVLCRIIANGVLASCQVISELPARVGIGAAAESLAREFRVDMTAVPEGQDLNGVETTIRVIFDSPTDPLAPLKPGWVAAPTAEDLAFPARARSAGIRKGLASVDCRVSPTGRLDDCKVAREDPEGAGFGEAALLLAPKFRMNPWTPEGRPVEGRTIRLPIGFVDDQAPAQPAK